MIPVPKSFYFATCKAGFKEQNKEDLAFIGTDRQAKAAGVFTQNTFQAAPIIIARQHLGQRQDFRGILVNSGQANACTGERGIDDCKKTIKLVAEKSGLQPQEILPASTGVIGEYMDLSLWEAAVKDLLSEKNYNSPLAVAKAMTTTDTYPKMVWRTLKYKEHEIRILGMAKGSGMICPNMATMLGFLICDAQIDAQFWQETLTKAVDLTFNRISVDGDTSTNDCVLALSNGASGITVDKSISDSFKSLVLEVCQELSYFIIQDAEGGTKVILVKVVGAQDQNQAEIVARTVAHSSLVKTAIFGKDPNWGRIVAAVGRSGAVFSPDNVTVYLAGILVMHRGQPIQEDIDSLLAPYLDRKDISMEIDLGQGQGEYSILTSDLSFDYVKINASYKT